MEYRNLGKSGLKVSEIGLGCIHFGWELDEKESAYVIHRALDLGVNFLDTANVYNEGRSEEFIGKAIKARRSDVIIATKFGMNTGNSPNSHGGSRYHILREIDASLKRLNMEYIDLYYIHFPDPGTPIEETLRTLDNLIKSGKIRYVGCSNFAAWQLCEALWTSKVNKLESFVIIETQYSYFYRHIEAELVPCCQAYNVGVVPWGPLARGFLAGDIQRGKQPAPPPGRTPLRPDVPQAPARPPTAGTDSDGIVTDANFDKLEKMKIFAAERGHTLSELAIAWLLSHKWLSSIIAGATKPEQVISNVAASKWVLSEEEIAQLG